ncbi:unnamed protein product, partial [marine sediment metagenome]
GGIDLKFLFLGYTPEKFSKEMAHEYWKNSSFSINGLFAH